MSKNEETDALLALEKDCWAKLFRGANKNNDDMHLMSVGTWSEDQIGLRTVVLRQVDTTNKLIFFFTDSRSEKYKSLLQNPQIVVLLYDSRHKIQIKVVGQAILDTDSPMAQTAWENTPLYSRKDYNSALAPGTIIDFPLATSSHSVLPEIETAREAGRENFVVVALHTQQIDYLQLRREGHLRALFKYENGVLTQKNWLVP